MTKKATTDGYGKIQQLHEGYIRKGGTNPDQSQVQARPADPAPMRPASSQSDKTQQPTKKNS